MKWSAPGSPVQITSEKTVTVPLELLFIGKTDHHLGVRPRHPCSPWCKGVAARARHTGPEESGAAVPGSGRLEDTGGRYAWTPIAARARPAADPDGRVALCARTGPGGLAPCGAGASRHAPNRSLVPSTALPPTLAEPSAIVPPVSPVVADPHPALLRQPASGPKRKPLSPQPGDDPSRTPRLPSFWLRLWTQAQLVPNSCREIHEKEASEGGEEKEPPVPSRAATRSPRQAPW